MLIFGFVPLYVVFGSNGLDFFPQRISFFDQSLPLLDIEAFEFVQPALAPADGQIEGRAIRNFTVVVEKPEVAADERAKPDQVCDLCEFVRRIERRVHSEPQVLHPEGEYSRGVQTYRLHHVPSQVRLESQTVY